MAIPDRLDLGATFTDSSIQSKWIPDRFDACELDKGRLLPFRYKDL